MDGKSKKISTISISQYSDENISFNSISRMSNIQFCLHYSALDTIATENKLREKRWERKNQKVDVEMIFHVPWFR